MFLYLSFSFSGVLGSTVSERGVYYLSFQYTLAFNVLKNGHLLNRYLVEFLEALALRQTFIDKDRVEVLHIAQTNQLVYRRIIAYITFILRMRVAPLFCCHSKQSHIEYVSFVSINQRTMVLTYLFRHKVCFDSVCMYMVVDLCQLALYRPIY